LVPEIFEVPAPVQSNMEEKCLFVFPIICIFFENHVEENYLKFSYIRIDLNKNMLLINFKHAFSVSQISQQSKAVE